MSLRHPVAGALFPLLLPSHHDILLFDVNLDIFSPVSLRKPILHSIHSLDTGPRRFVVCKAHQPRTVAVVYKARVAEIVHHV